MIRMKDVMKRLETVEAETDTSIKALHEKIDWLVEFVKQMAKDVDETKDQLYRTEAALAMWQRKYEQTLNKEDK